MDSSPRKGARAEKASDPLIHWSPIPGDIASLSTQAQDPHASHSNASDNPIGLGQSPRKHTLKEQRGARFTGALAPGAPVANASLADLLDEVGDEVGGDISEWPTALNLGPARHGDHAAVATAVRSVTAQAPAPVQAPPSGRGRRHADGHTASARKAVALGDRVEARRPGAALISGAVFVFLIVGYNLMWTRFIPLAQPTNGLDLIQHYLFYAWLLALPQTLLNLQGFLLTHPKAPLFTTDSVRDALRTPLHIRIVTHGTNPDVVRKTLEADHGVITAFARRYGVRPRVVVELVTDNALPIHALQYVVPQDFTTPNGALFKARALQYAVETIRMPADAWILHCDEETQITLSGLQGCLQFMQREIASAAPGRFPPIGQGTILYHRDFWSRPFMTMADSIRTAMDFGYFRVQYHVWHRPLLGVHGSFILVRQDIEQAVNFDFDGYRSITEDAYWALLLVERGIRIKWVHGYLSEQATFGVMDFLRQRRRWFTGLWHVLGGKGVRWRTRLMLQLAVVSWACAFMGTTAILLQFVHPVYVPWYIILLSSVSLATYSSITVYGLLVNLTELPLNTGWINWLIVLAQVSLMPVFGLMESAALFWGLFTVNRVKFHVVKK